MVRRMAVCDDEWSAQQQIALYLDRIAAETGDTYETFYFASAEALLTQMPRDVQVILLDIQMGETTGMEAARKLREEGLDTHILFITSNASYALEGYDVHAFAFLRKPVVYEVLRRHLLDAFRQVDQRRGQTISMPTPSGMDIIDLNTLIYVEVLRHQTTFVTDTGGAAYLCPLSSVEEKLRRYGFFRCHKSYLVNLKKITRITADSALMTGGHTVPVSKYRRRELLEQMAACIGTQL